MSGADQEKIRLSRAKEVKADLLSVKLLKNSELLMKCLEMKEESSKTKVVNLDVLSCLKSDTEKIATNSI